MNSKNMLLKLFAVIFMSTFTLFSVSAIQDFTVDPSTTVYQSVETGTTSNYIDITISSTGNESIDLTFSKVDLVSGSNYIPLTINSTSILALANDTSTILRATYDAGTNIGTFIGSIKIENPNNLSQYKIIPIYINVTLPSNVAGASIEFEGQGSILEMIVDIDDNSEKETFTLRNNGNIRLNDIEIDLDSRFRGDDVDIDDDDFEINGENGDETYSLKDDEGIDYLDVSETFDIKFDLDIPSNLDVDDYRGDIYISYLPEGSATRVTQTFTLKIIGESDNEDVYIDPSAEDVFDGKLKVFVEPGETLDNIEFRIVNDASFDVEGITFEIDSDLEEENSALLLSKSIISFKEDSIDISDRDYENIEIEIDMPENQATGKYATDLIIRSSTGKELDKIEIEIEVIGDIYIEKLEFLPTINPGDYLEVEVTVTNKGSTTQRNVKVKGSLFDIDSSSSDIHESSSNFLLENGATRTETLRFKIPKDASDGSHILEINVDYEDNLITEIENVDVARPTHEIVVESFAVNPTYAKCHESVYTYLKFQNLGKYDEDVKVTVEIEETDISKSTNTIEIGVDEIMQKSLVLDITTLNPGTYTINQKVEYGTLSEIRESTLRVSECNSASVEGIDIKEINKTETINETFTKDNSLEIFGQEIEKTTAYLAGGVGTTFLLIVLALVLL